MIALVSDLTHESNQFMSLQYKPLQLHVLNMNREQAEFGHLTNSHTTRLQRQSEALKSMERHLETLFNASNDHLTVQQSQTESIVHLESRLESEVANINTQVESEIVQIEDQVTANINRLTTTILTLEDRLSSTRQEATALRVNVKNLMTQVTGSSGISDQHNGNISSLQANMTSLEEQFQRLNLNGATPKNPALVGNILNAGRATSSAMPPPVYPNPATGSNSIPLGQCDHLYSNHNKGRRHRRT